MLFRFQTQQKKAHSLNSKVHKQRGFGTLDLSIYIVVIGILLLAGIRGYNSMQDQARRTTTRDELGTISQACVAYEADSASGTLPANLGALVTGLTAAQSSDGVAHGPYVSKSTWTTDSTTFKDGWGTAYVYSSTNRTISSTNNGGTAITKSF